ncbi:MAG: hypothetical protein AB8I80_10240, partial [Anaerolineae bacterium]
MIQLTETGLIARSGTTEVAFEGVRLASIRDATTGEAFLDPAPEEGIAGFELLHQSGERSPLGVHPLASEVHYTLLTDRVAEIVLHDWECDLSVRVSVDEGSGDILIEPSAWTMQGGIAGVAIKVAGIREDLAVIAPFQQGVRAPMAHPQLQGKEATWPSGWEAGFVVFAGDASGFTVQTW